MLRTKIRELPRSPGVYFFKDVGGKTIYIGKAASLKDRVGSYFVISKDPRVKRMLEAADKLGWQETGSEIEALILESQLIKKNRPIFNIMLRDDKQYFYVIFTKEKFSKIFSAHQLGRYEARNIIGPFTDGMALKTTLKTLRRIFPYCTCKQKHINYCLNYHIGKCLGFCCLRAGAKSSELAEYQKNIEVIKDILTGKKKLAVKKMILEMETEAKKENFEKAIELREKIDKLSRVFENVAIIRQMADRERALKALQKQFKLPNLPKRIEGYDISNIQGRFATGSMVVFYNGQPDKNEYRKFKIRYTKSGDVPMLQEIIKRRLNHPEWSAPDLILVDGGKAQLNVGRAMLKTNNKNIPILALTKNVRHLGDHVFSSTLNEPVYIEKLSKEVRNLILAIDSEAHRFAISYYRKLHGKDIHSS